MFRENTNRNYRENDFKNRKYYSNEINNQLKFQNISLKK